MARPVISSTAHVDVVLTAMDNTDTVLVRGDFPLEFVLSGLGGLLGSVHELLLA